MGIINSRKMKFVLALIAVAAAQVCTDEDAGDTCEEGACCGHNTDAAAVVTRTCSTADQSAAAAVSDAGPPEGTFSCDAPVAMEGAAKMALGASVLAAALYMA